MNNKETVYVVRGNKMWAYYTDKNDFLASGTKHIECKHGDVFDFEYGKKLLDAKLANDYKLVKELIHGKKSPIVDYSWFTIERFRRSNFVVICNTEQEKMALLDFTLNVILKGRFLNIDTYMSFRGKKWKINDNILSFYCFNNCLCFNEGVDKSVHGIHYSKFRELANSAWKKENL